MGEKKKKEKGKEGRNRKGKKRLQKENRKGAEVPRESVKEGESVGVS